MDNPTNRRYRDGVGAYTDKGPVRPANEDAYWVPEAQSPVEWGHLYLVADGVGGQAEGAAAAQLAVLAIRDAFYRGRQNGRDIPAALEQAIHRANQVIFDEAAAQGVQKMGATLVAAVPHEGTVYVAHVGDARAYLLRPQEGKLYRLTRDDSWVERQVQEGVISAQDAARHALRNIVTQVLGNKQEIEVNQSSYPLLPGDVLLLCSDGLHDTLPSARMKEILQTQEAATAARSLVQAAVEGQAKDNVTAVVVHPAAAKLRGAAAAARDGGTAVNRRRRLGLAAGGLLLLLLLVALASWLAGRGGNGEETAPELAVTPVVAGPPAAGHRPTSTLAPSPTPEPSATPTAVPSLTPSPPPQPTPISPPLVCVIGEPVFIWRDDQIAAEDCSATISLEEEDYILSLGDALLLLDPTPITVQGPDTSCATNQFVRVQSVTNPEVEGWVLVGTFAEPETGQNCP